MFYFFLLVLGAFMAAMGVRANIFNLEIRKMTERVTYSGEQAAIWHEMGGFNILLLDFGPNMILSFLAGAGVLTAYLGLWKCALGSLSGLVMVILGAAVCGLIQYTMIARIRAYFAEYEKEIGEDPRPYFTGKNSIPHAVYTSVMIGIGKVVKLILLVSVVGILLYVILRQAALKVLDLEEAVVRGDYQFPPKTIYDEDDNPWVCTDTMGEEGCIKIYSPATAVKRADMNLRLCVDTKKALKEAPDATKLKVGDRIFHW